MLKQIGNKVYRRFDKELLCIQPWGKNSFRVQATQRHELIEDEDISALLPAEEVSVKVYERGTDRKTPFPEPEWKASPGGI